MGWKDWSYWLKGGIITVGILLIWTILIGLTNFIFGGVTSFADNSGKFILVLLSLVINIVPKEDYGLGILVGLITIYILTPIFWFSIGAFIGWIVGKIKSK